MLIDVLSGAVDGDDQPVEAAFDGAFGVFVVQVMGIGGRRGVDVFIGRVFDHVQKIGIEIGFSLKVEDQISEIAVELIDGIAKEIGLEHAGGTGEGAQSARTFRATQVAGGGGFNRYGKWIAPMDGSSDQAT